MKEGWFKPALVGSLALLAGSAQFFAYATYVHPRERAANELQALAGLLQVETQRRPAAQPSAGQGATLPDLLTRTQELAAEHAITVVGVEPVPGDTEQFKLNLAAPYDHLLEFVANFEALQVSISGFDIAPAMENRGLLAASLTFSHIPAPSVAPERIKEFSARLRAVALRDPFNPSTALIRMAADPDATDLTWTYHLTSISQIGKTRYATIDGRDYNIGDRLKGLVVSAIGEDNVTLLDGENGKQRRRFLKFRDVRGERI